MLTKTVTTHYPWHLPCGTDDAAIFTNCVADGFGGFCSSYKGIYTDFRLFYVSLKSPHRSFEFVFNQEKILGKLQNIIQE